MASLKEQFESGVLEVSWKGDTVELDMPEWMKAPDLDGLVAGVHEGTTWTKEQAQAFVLAQARQNIATGLRAAWKGRMEARDKAREAGKAVPPDLDTAEWFPEGFGKRGRTVKEKAQASLADLIKSGKVSADELMEMIRNAAGK